MLQFSQYQKEYNVAYYEKNKDKYKENAQKYYQEHKEEIKIANKKYRDEHKEEINKIAREKYASNPEFYCEKARNYYARKHGSTNKVTKYKYRDRKEYDKYFRATHREYERNKSCKRQGITLDIFNTLLEKQNNKCAICGKDIGEFSRAFAIDHNHITGEIRGLLCHNCNGGLGLFMDNVESLQNAINYLSS